MALRLYRPTFCYYPAMKTLIYPSYIGFPTKECVLFVLWLGATTRNSGSIARSRNNATGQTRRAILGKTCS